MPHLNGFVVLHRSLLNWGWHSDPATGWLFVNLILLASYAPSEWKGIPLDRGQLITGRKALAKQTGLSERQIRTALEHLKSTGEVTIQTTNQYSLITLVNYRKFQDIPNEVTSKTTTVTTNDRPATDHIVTKKQNKQDIEVVADAPPAQKRFIKPTLEEVVAYCAERNRGVDPHRFFDYYEANGWRVGKSSMKSWQAAVRTWEKPKEQKTKNTGGDTFAGYSRF